MFFRQKASGFTDMELIEQFHRTGDLALVSELFGRYTTMIYGVCLKYLRDRDNAKDAVMQIFEKLPTTLQTHQIANFRGWVHVTARNHCLMQLRARKGKITEEIGQHDVETRLVLHLEDEPELENDLSRLEKCIRELGDEQQQCVRLFFLEEKCYKDVATVTGFDLLKVKSYIQNGKRNLRICMEKNE
jgi:RNA polymerase sigma-70 factor (ECF subfamily)